MVGLFIYGLFDRDRYSVNRQTENSYPIKTIIVLIAEAHLQRPSLEGLLWKKKRFKQ